MNYASNQEILRTFFGGETEARKILQIKGKIAEVCMGRRKQASGFGWEYANVKKCNRISEWDKWKVLEDFPSYKISRDGRIYSCFHKKILEIKPLAGYVKSSFTNKNGVMIRTSIHRLVALAYIPNPNNYPIVNHLDENGTNNRVENLEWTTSKGNSQHSIHKNINAHKRKGHKFK